MANTTLETTDQTTDEVNPELTALDLPLPEPTDAPESDEQTDERSTDQPVKVPAPTGKVKVAGDENKYPATDVRLFVGRTMRHLHAVGWDRTSLTVEMVKLHLTVDDEGQPLVANTGYNGSAFWRAIGKVALADATVDTLSYVHVSEVNDYYALFQHLVAPSDDGAQATIDLTDWQANDFKVGPRYGKGGNGKSKVVDVSEYTATINRLVVESGTAADVLANALDANGTKATLTEAMRAALAVLRPAPETVERVDVESTDDQTDDQS